jgi:peptidase S41-like protein
MQAKSNGGFTVGSTRTRCSVGEQMRISFSVIAITMLLSVTSLFAQSQQTTPAAVNSPPLSASDIEHGLKAGVTNTRMASLVKQYGVDFELTDVVEKQLRGAGANSDLLLAISRGKRSGGTSEKSHSADPIPLNAPATTQTPAPSSARYSVDLHFLVRPEIGYMHIAQFNETTDKEVQDALDSFYQSGELKGLILDLRQNPGGLLSEAVGVADKFLHKGQLIVSDHGCSSPERGYTAMHGNGGKDYPLVVLVNRGTASAAEVVAGTIQDHDRGLVAGQTTYSSGDAANKEVQVKLTDSGRTVYCGGGITPDVLIDPVKSNTFQNTLLQHQAFSNFAKHYIVAHRVTKSFDVDDAIMQEFRKSLNADNVPYTESDFLQNNEWLRSDLKNEIFVDAFGQEEGLKVKAETDPEVLRALDFLPMARALVDNARR